MVDDVAVESAPTIIDGRDTPQKFNPLSPKSIGRLREGIEKGVQKLKKARKDRVDLIRQYVGSHYGDGGAHEKVPVNLLALNTIIDIQWLAARIPTVSVSTPFEEYRPFANSLELGMRKHLHQTKFGKAMRGVILDALFAMGIMKVGKADAGMIAWDDVNYKLQKPFADRVDFDDWVHDPRARNIESADFMGNIWQIPYDVLMESQEFQNTEGIKPDDCYSEDEKKAREISKDHQGMNRGDFREYVDLIDVYLPFERVVVTLHYRGERNRPVRVVDYSGPPTGPYHILKFHDVPDNILPLSPLGLLRDVHELANHLYRKAGRQAERQKTITAYTPGAAKDMDRVVNSSDGDTIQVQHIDQIKEINFGAANPMTQAMFLQCKDIFSWLAGNLDALGGLGPQSETAKQDKLLMEAASAAMKAKQDAVYEFTDDVVDDIAWCLCDSPMSYIPIAKSIPDMSDPIYVPTEMMSSEMLGDFLDYNFKIEPHSMQPQSPEQKIQALMQIMSMYSPFLPAMQAQGVDWNFEKLIKRTAKMADLPELAESVMFAQPQQQDTPLAEPRGLPKSQMSTRKYVRINRPGGTVQGKDAAMIQTLMGQASQPSEMAGMNQSTG